jgi:hypothetical protein
MIGPAERGDRAEEAREHAGGHLRRARGVDLGLHRAERDGHEQPHADDRGHRVDRHAGDQRRPGDRPGHAPGGQAQHAAGVDRRALATAIESTIGRASSSGVVGHRLGAREQQRRHDHRA